MAKLYLLGAGGRDRYSPDLGNIKRILGILIFNLPSTFTSENSNKREGQPDSEPVDKYYFISNIASVRSYLKIELERDLIKTTISVRCSCFTLLFRFSLIFTNNRQKTTVAICCFCIYYFLRLNKFVQKYMSFQHNSL